MQLAQACAETQVFVALAAAAALVILLLFVAGGWVALRSLRRAQASTDLWRDCWLVPEAE